MKENLSPLDALLDENNADNVVLYNADEQPVEFVQIAIVVLDGEIYPILKPAALMEGIAENEALVFTIREIDGEDCLVLEEDDAIIDAVFEEYYRMLG